MGWLRWTENEVLDTTMPAMEQAIISHIEMLRETTGRPIKPPKLVSEPNVAKSQFMTMVLFDAIFGDPNHG